MSNFSQDTPCPSAETPPDFTDLAITLQKAAQALLVLSSTNTPDKQETAVTKSASHDRDGEIRSFYFPPATMHLEKELLRKYRAEDFQGLLEEVHTLLVGLVKLMQSVHKDVRVRGYVISSLGAQLNHASALILRMRNIYDRVVPVQS